MQYLLLLYSNKADEPKYGTAEMEAHMQGHFTFNEDVQKAGKFIAGDALQPIPTATTLRI